LTITVNRNVGTGDISAIYFIISDGENTKTIQKETTLQELGSESFTIQSSEIQGISLIKEVSIAPVINGNAGNIADTETFSTDQILEDWGLIYRQGFETDMKPFVDARDGTIVIDNTEFLSGTSSLKHTSNAIVSPHDSYTRPYGGVSSVINNYVSDESYTFSAAVKSGSTPVTNQLQMFIFCLDSNYNLISPHVQRQFTPTNEWEVYSLTRTCPSGTSYVSIRFDNDAVSGAISFYDEVMVFNKAVSENQLEELYELI